MSRKYTPDYRLKPAGLALGGLSRGDKSYPSHVFHRVMEQSDRDDFDGALVDMKHRLAYEAGTQESRFTDYVQELHAKRITFQPLLGLVIAAVGNRNSLVCQCQ